MNLIVSAAIVLLNPYVTVYISYKIPPFALSVHIPDVSTSIYVEVDSKVLLGLPFCDKAFVRLTCGQQRTYDRHINRSFVITTEEKIFSA